MKRFLGALLSVACIFSAVPAHARLVTVFPKFTYVRAFGSTIPDSDMVSAQVTLGAASGIANRTDTTACISVADAGSNDGRPITATPDSMLGVRVIIFNNDPTQDGTMGAAGIDSMIVSIQGSTLSGIHQTGQNAPVSGGVISAFVSNDRLDFSSAGTNKIIQINTIKIPKPGLHALPSVGNLNGVESIRVILKQDNTQTTYSIP